MWFKNLRPYRFTYAIDLEPDTLEAALAAHAFAPCTPIDTARAGWTAPLGREGSQFTHPVGRATMVCLRRQEKILPPAAIRETLNERVESFEVREGRPMHRKERAALRDEVRHDLLPRALTRSDHLYGFFDTGRQLLLIDAISAAKAELMLDNLRAALGALPVVPLAPRGDVADILTRWVRERTPDGIELDAECELQNTRDAKNVVRCRHQEIDSREVLVHLDAGKRVTQLALNWRDTIRFVLGEDFSLRRLRFEAKIRGHDDGEADDPAGRFDQDFAVMSLQLGRLLDELIAACGGPEQD